MTVLLTLLAAAAVFLMAVLLLIGVSRLTGRDVRGLGGADSCSCPR